MTPITWNKGQVRLTNERAQLYEARYYFRSRPIACKEESGIPQCSSDITYIAHVKNVTFSDLTAGNYLF